MQTKTLRYNKAGWVTVERLEQHWVKATVDARIIDPPGVREQPLPNGCLANVDHALEY